MYKLYKNKNWQIYWFQIFFNPPQSVLTLSTKIYYKADINSSSDVRTLFDTIPHMLT